MSNLKNVESKEFNEETEKWTRAERKCYIEGCRAKEEEIMNKIINGMRSNHESEDYILEFLLSILNLSIEEAKHYMNCKDSKN